MTFFEISIVVVLLLMALAMLYLGLMFRNTIAGQQSDLNAAITEIDRLRELETAAHERSFRSINDRLELIEIIQLVWDSRDTEAAANCVKYLVVPGIDGRHYTIHDCHVKLREDLGIEPLEKAA